jgi:hypothetical protein
MSEPLLAQPHHPEPIRLFFAPTQGHGLGEVRLAAAERAYEAPVLRPINLSRSHGVNIRVEDLREAAAAYDPATIAAPLNFDHAWGGPSHGWCSRLWMEAETLWARFEQLSAEAVAAIESGQWPRRSSEFYTDHPATGGYYFTGLALLGNSTPAVWGLGPARLLSGRPITVVDLGAPAPQETPMLPKDTAPPAEVVELAATADPIVTDETTPAATETTAAITFAAPPESAELLQLRSELAALRASSAEVAAREHRLVAREAIDRLGARCTPAMRRVAEPLLAMLRGASPGEVHLAADRSLAAADALLELLAAVPEFQALSVGATAGPAADDVARLAADDRTEEVRRWHARFGLKDERVLELRQKYSRTPN